MIWERRPTALTDPAQEKPATVTTAHPQADTDMSNFAKPLRILSAVVLLAIIVTAGFVWLRLADGLSFKSAGHSFPQQVIASQPSPTGRYTARILFDENTKGYLFALEGRDGTRLVLDKKFVPSVAHHAPIITLSWPGPDLVRLVVDHDFGESKLAFDFNVRDLSFKERKP